MTPDIDRALAHVVEARRAAVIDLLEALDAGFGGKLPEPRVSHRSSDEGSPITLAWALGRRLVFIVCGDDGTCVVSTETSSCVYDGTMKGIDLAAVEGALRERM